MEFHLVGKVDDQGRVVAVQSTVQPLVSLVTTLQLPVEPQRQVELVKDDHGDLLYKLDSKSKEMSNMILHIHQLQEENKFQKKLMEKYEQDMKAKDFEIYQLTLKNQQLEETFHKLGETGNRSSFPMRQSLQKTSFQMTCNVMCTSRTDVKYLSCPTTNVASSKNGALFQTQKNTGGLDCVDAPTSSQVEERQQACETNSMSSCHGDSSSPLIDLVDSSRSDMPEMLPESDSAVLKKDEQGYLVLQMPDTETQDEQVHVTSDSIQRDRDSQSKPAATGSASGCSVPESPVFNFSMTVCQCSPPPNHHGNETYVFSDSGYCCIDDEDVPDETSVSPPADNDRGIYHSQIRRNSSTEGSKCDKGLTNLVQMMRTTMEWQKAKKSLMQRSTSCTSDCAESFLKDVLKECLYVTKRMDSRRSSSGGLRDEKWVSRVKNKYKNQAESECITPDFITKCLYVSSRQSAPPPH